MTIFVDTNVLVYSRDASEPERQPQARAWLDHLWATGTGRTSTQVLNEFYVTVTRKLSPGMAAADARADVRDLSAWNPSVLDDDTIELAWRLEDDHQLSWWDALIVAAAIERGCDRLLSEDLQDGRRYESLLVIDPFRHTPGT